MNTSAGKPKAETTPTTADNSFKTAIESMGGMITFPHGVSMLPLIRQGKGYVSAVKVDNPQVGDILLFEQMRQGGKTSILHRLVEIRRDGTYVCRGDNCLNCELIGRSDIIGRADRIFWVKKAGGLMPWLLGAERDRRNGGYAISVTARGYKRYVRFWNAIWPLRKQFYRARNAKNRVSHRLSRIGWLRKLYHALH